MHKNWQTYTYNRWNGILRNAINQISGNFAPLNRKLGDYYSLIFEAVMYWHLLFAVTLWIVKSGVEGSRKVWCENNIIWISHMLLANVRVEPTCMVGFTKLTVWCIKLKKFVIRFLLHKYVNYIREISLKLSFFKSPLSFC